MNNEVQGFVDIEPSEYHANMTRGALSHSMLECFRRSPQEYFERYVARTIPRETTPQMELGTAVHMACLEPEKFATEVIEIPPEVLSANGSRSGGKWKAFQEDNRDRLLLRAQDFAPIRRMRDAVYACPMARKLLESCDKKEQAAYWTRDGLDCKALIDGLGERVIIDIKTAKSSRPQDFATQAANMGYHRQAEWYQGGVHTITGKSLPFIFIVVQNTPPYTVECIQLSDDFIAAAAVDNQEDVRKFLACDERDYWRSPTYDQVVKVEPPAWLKFQDQWSLPNGD